MPYNSVAEARKKVSSLSSLSDKQVEVFNEVFNSLHAQGKEESEIIPIAIAQAKKIEKDFEVFHEEALKPSIFHKAKTTKDSKGNIVYRGEKFPGFNKPMKDSGSKQGKVLVKEGDKISIVRFGDSSLRDNYSNEANDRFYSRFGGQSSINDKFSPLYWSAKHLWPRGELKGKGPKPFYKLKKGKNMNEVEKSRSAMMHFLQGMMEYLSPSREDDEKEAYEIDELREELLEDVEDKFEMAEKEKLWVETVHASADQVYKDEMGSVVIKAFDEEKMVSYDPLYVNVGESDVHGDGITDEQMDKLVENINTKIKDGVLKAMIHHSYPTEGYHYVKASRMPMDAFIENPLAEGGKIKIEEGQPILKTQFTNKVLWEKKKAGVLKNPSIGGKGKRVPNPDYEGD